MNALRWYLLVTVFGLALLALATRHWWASRGSRAGGRWGTSTSEAGTWKVEAKVEQIHGRHPADESQRVTVVLRDARGRELETPEIGFSLDETPLVYRVGTGNYYDRHPYYRLDRDTKVRIAPDTDHQLTMTRSNAPAIAFARVRTPTSLSASNFQVPPRHARDRDLVVAWSGLRQSAEVLIYRTVESADGQGNVTIEAGGPYAEDAIRHRIGAGAVASALDRGQLTIPSTYFRGSVGRMVTSLTLEITATNQGEFLQPVREGSAITALHKLTLGVELVSP